MNPKIQVSSCRNVYDSYIKKELQYTKWLLTVLGIWPMILPNATKLEKLTSLIAIVLSSFVILLSSIAMIMFMFLKLTTWRRRLVFLGPMGFRISNYLKYLFIIYRSNIIKKCVNSMKLNWSKISINEDHTVMIESTNLGRQLTNICAAFMCSAGIFFQIIMPLVKPKQINAFNVTLRPLVLPGYDFFFNTQVTPVYQIVYGLQFLSAAAIYTIVTASSNLAAVFVSHICGQVKLIKSKFQRIEKDFDNYEIDRQIASIIKCHIRILKFAENVNRILSEICLIEVVHSTVVICWLEFFCLTEWENSEPISLITYFLLLVSLTFNIFILCFIGEILKNQCEFVGEMTYMIDWYKIPKRNILSLILIITMAQKSCSITAGGMMEMTFQSFLDILKTSAAYFQMLRTVMETS